MTNRYTDSRFVFFLTGVLILPVLLLFSSFSSFDELVKEEQVKQTGNKMEEILERISEIHDDKVFFHLWLQRLFLRQDASPSTDPGKSFYTKVKKQFKDNARVIIWDQSGKIVKELSDEKRYQYVLHKMYQAMKDISEIIKIPFDSSPEHLPSVADNISLFRKFFGPLIFSQKMDLPMYVGTRGQMLEISNEAEKGFAWWQKGSNFSAVVFLNKKLRRKNIGLMSLLKSFNQKSPDLKIGFYTLPDFNYHGPSFAAKTSAMLDIHSRNFLKSFAEIQTSENFYTKFHLIPHEILCFAIHKKPPDFSPSLQIFFKGFAFLSILAFILYCCSLVAAEFFLSVKTRIISLMLFSAALPGLAFALIGYEYFHHKTNSLINFHHLDGQRILKEFDSLYPLKKQEIASEIDAVSTRFYRSFPAGGFRETDLKELKKIVEKFAPTELGFYDVPSGIKMIEQSGTVNFVTYPALKRYLDQLVNGMASSRTLARKYVEKGTAGFVSDYATLGMNLDQLHRILPNRLAFVSRLVYRGNLNSSMEKPALLFLTWDKEKFQNLFFEMELDKLNQMIFPGRVIAAFNDTDRIFPIGKKYPSEIRRFFKKASLSKSVFAESLETGRQDYVACAIKGLNLESTSLIYLYPRHLIEEQVQNLRMKIFFAMLLFFVLIIWFVVKFTLARIEPIDILKESLLAVSKKEFNLKLEYKSGDEFEELIDAFNVSVENMKDLAVARTVQEGLLPPSDFSLGRIEIFATTSFMTSMGGDYYDIATSRDRVLLAFGDVAGHGTAAAFMMAMIKAVFTECAEQNRPDLFIEKCQKVMNYLESRGESRMMTLQLLNLDPENGEFYMENAGHCFPVQISDSGRNLDFIKSVAMPLGVKILPEITRINAQLNPGDYLVLYSDGIVEAINDHNEMFGFTRLFNLLQSNYGLSPEQFCKNVIAEVNHWGTRQNDDLSLMVVRFVR